MIRPIGVGSLVTFPGPEGIAQLSGGTSAGSLASGASLKMGPGALHSTCRLPKSLLFGRSFLAHATPEAEMMNCLQLKTELLELRKSVQILS